MRRRLQPGRRPSSNERTRRRWSSSGNRGRRRRVSSLGGDPRAGVLKRRSLTCGNAVVACPGFGAPRGGSPLTRPLADLSPEGRGAEDESAMLQGLCVAKATSVRPRPDGERDGVRGPRNADETGRNSQPVRNRRFNTPPLRWGVEKLGLSDLQGPPDTSCFCCALRRSPPHPAVGRPLPEGGEVPKMKGQSTNGFTPRRE